MADDEQQDSRAGRARRGRSTARGAEEAAVDREALEELLGALRAARDGATGVRVPGRKRGLAGELATAFNELAEIREQTTKELVRVGRIVGRDGRLTERASIQGAQGSWAASLDAVNGMVDDLVRPTNEVARVIEAVAEGDLSQKIALRIDGQPLKGEFLRVGTIVNATSLGGTTTTLETRTRWEGDRVPANLVRLSVGLEDVELLWDDLAQALDRA